MKIPDELKQIAETAKASGQVGITVRQLLGFYRYARRGSWINEQIKDHLDQLGLVTVPDFEGLYFDATLYLIPKEKAPKPQPAPPDQSASGVSDSDTPDRSSDPTHQISRLAAANHPPLSVTPNDKVETAVTHMLANDYSQLPVMQSTREVKGVISWKSIGSRTRLGNECELVKDCTEPHKELKSNVSMFEAIRLLAEHDCVLVKSVTDNTIPPYTNPGPAPAGISTTSHSTGRQHRNHWLALHIRRCSTPRCV